MPLKERVFDGECGNQLLDRENAAINLAIVPAIGESGCVFLNSHL